MDGDREILEHLEPALREASPDAAAAMVALVALEQVRFDPDELSGSVRRALLVQAAGGDLLRELRLDDPAVARLAADLDSAERRAELEGALVELRRQAAELPAATAALEPLVGDAERAWRALSAAILADELTG